MHDEASDGIGTDGMNFQANDSGHTENEVRLV